MSTSKPATTKSGLHPRNPHRAHYDFPQLIAGTPELASHVYQTKRGQQSIDFADPSAVKALNQALLKQFYQVDFWDIPEGYLCPAIPGRADYIHHIADLLAISNKGEVPHGKRVQALDIGTGANCVYPIIGSQSYGWRFIGSDLNPVSVDSAKQLVKFNRALADKIKLRQQKAAQHIFTNIIKADELIDITLCNPPFHASAKEAAAGSERKVRNLQKGKTSPKAGKATLNFGGQNAELWCKGGEIAFLRNMINESTEFAEQCLWFTSLVSKKENLSPVYNALKKAGAVQVETLEMAQGQKVSRVVAWSFLTTEQHQQWAIERWR